MEKDIKKAIILNIPLLIWFFLDMTGFSIGNNILVTRSYQADGIFLVIYLISLVGFIYKREMENSFTNMVILLVFSTNVFPLVFYYIWEGKNKYFADTIKLISHPERYIPDLYHIVLHIFILVALIGTLKYFKRNGETTK